MWLEMSCKKVEWGLLWTVMRFEVVVVERGQESVRLA